MSTYLSGNLDVSLESAKDKLTADKILDFVRGVQVAVSNMHGLLVIALKSPAVLCCGLKSAPLKEKN